MNIADNRRTVTASVTAVVMAGALGACGYSAPPAPAPPAQYAPPPATGGAMPPGPSSSPAYPSLGERPGNPDRIATDDLHLAVDSAQTAVSGSRLISVSPVNAGGHPIWLVKLATEGPSIKLVDVDAILRGAKSRDAEFTEQDRARVRDLLNATKVFWPDAVKTVERQRPDAIPSAVLLDGKVGNPTAPVWKITVLSGKDQVEYTVDAVSGAMSQPKTTPRKPHDYG